MQIYREFFRILNDHSVRYLVTGGIAVNLYGIPRATADIDLVIKLDSENITRFVSAAREIGLVPRAPVLLKERTGRPQDKADAYYLRKILEDQADEG